MTPLPAGVEPYRRTPEFDEATVPAGLLRDHRTAAGVWGTIRVLSGRLRYLVPDRGIDAELTPDRVGVIEPEVPHRVEPVGPVRFFVEFHRAPAGDGKRPG